ncbi:MAG: hypothetical protein AB7E13_09010 [Arcobacteraceae bacterium]
MKKLLFLFFCISGMLNASLLHDKIGDIIGYNEYNKNKNIINVLFQDENKFLAGGELNVVAVLEELRKNGLLKLKFVDPQDFTLEFYTNNVTLSSVYIIRNVLSSMGYQYYFIQNIEKNSKENLLKISIVLNTEYKVDPILLSRELTKNQVRILDITKKDNEAWVYKIDMKNAIVSDALFVATDEKISLPKPLKPYLIQIDRASEINIMSKKLDNWFPYVVFYDDKLNPLYVIEKQETFSGIKSAVPAGTKYIQIGDLYNLVNIKRGLTLVIKG